MVRRVSPQHAGRETVDRPTDIQMRFPFEMSGSAGDPQVLEDSDQEALRPTNGSRSFIDLSTPSPPPPVRILPLRDLSRSATSSLNPTTLKPLSKRTSLRSSTPRTPHDPTPIKVSASGSKKSPGSSHAATNGMSQTGHEPPVEETNSPQDENGVEREEDERSEKPYDLRGDSSRHPSLDDPDSQESLGRSIGSTSPLLIRLKVQRNRVRNPPSDSNVPRSSPREEILDRSGLPESESRNQDLTDAKIKQFLLNFEQEMFDDHAASVRWLLYDSKQPVEHADTFLDEVSPFASKEPVSVLPGSIIPEVAITVKMETFVCILSPPVDSPAQKYRPAGRIEPEKQSFSLSRKRLKATPPACRGIARIRTSDVIFFPWMMRGLGSFRIWEMPKRQKRKMLD
jgi:hypothetical protein